MYVASTWKRQPSMGQLPLDGHAGRGTSQLCSEYILSFDWTIHEKMFSQPRCSSIINTDFSARKEAIFIERIHLVVMRYCGVRKEMEIFPE